MCIDADDTALQLADMCGDVGNARRRTVQVCVEAMTCTQRQADGLTDR